MTNRASHPHELISAMLDGEIDERERAVVEAHLRECPECRDLAGDLTALGAVLADDPVPPVPAGLAERIGWSLRSQGASRRRLGGMRWPGPGTLAALGGVAAAGILAVLVVREGSAPFLERSPALTGQRAASDDVKPSAERDEAQEKLRNLGYASTEGTARGYRNGDDLDAPRADGRRQQPDSAAGAGGAMGAGPGSGASTMKRDNLAYAPSPAETAPSEPLAGLAVAQPTPVLAPLVDKKAQAGREISKLEGGVTSSTVAPSAESPALQERAKKAPTADAPLSMEEEKVVGGAGRLSDDSQGGGSVANKDTGASGAPPAGKEAVAGNAAPRDAVAPPPAAPAPPLPQDAYAARGEVRALRPSPAKSKVIDNESLAKQTIAACPGAEGAKPVKRWAATSAPLPLRTALADAEPDLAALAARLGGTLCAERLSGATPLLVLDAPVGRWSELRAALATRAESSGSLTPPPAEGFDIVRVVLRPR
jgi:hypothetical protein